MQLTEQQQKVKALIYEQGKSQKEAAALAGASEKSVGNWIKKFMWKEQMESKLKAMDKADLLAPLDVPALINKMKVKKAQALILIEQKGYNQKQAAKAVGVSERTMSLWMKAKEDVNMDAFLSHLKSSNEGLYKEIFEALQQYKKRLQETL